jgi:hypothetical protein
MTATRSDCPLDAHGAAELYLQKGLAAIPLPPRSKEPGYPNWQHLRLTLDTLDQHFPPRAALNVGILNGAPSDNTADVDLDCAEALVLAPQFLPATGWVFGRVSAPRSHQVYRTDPALETAQEEYQDVDGTMLVELRGSGGLTVYPPSTHKETGERITWERFTEPADVELAALQRAVRELSAASILARHWPHEGSRDNAAMALSGGLIRAGWEEEKVSRFCQAVAVAAGDEESRKRAGKAKPTARKQADGKQTTGWPTLAKALRDDGPEVVDRVQDWLGLKDTTAPELPLPVEPPWPAPLADEAFHGLAGDAVRVLGPASEADPVALLLQTLIGFGSVLGRGSHFVVEADRHAANEYGVLVGRTSKARKGSSWGRTLQVLVPADETWANERVQSGLSSGEGLIWAVRDPVAKQERIREKNQVRYEEVEADPGIQDKRLLVYEPEFASVLKQTERQGNTLSTVIRQAWDSGSLRTLTKNTPARATNAHISLIGHITSEELRRYLSTTEAANGFGNRFLWVAVKRSKALPEGGEPDAHALADVQSRLGAAAAFARTVGAMHRDNEARELWREIYGDLSEGRPGLTGALLGRAEAHVMRLALIYALLDQSREIGAPHLLAALALWQYVEDSVRHVFGDSLGDPVADDLLRLLRGCPQGLTRNDLTNYLGRHQSSERIGRALGLLLQHGLARREQEQTSGRPAERWFAALRSRGE